MGLVAAAAADGLEALVEAAAGQADAGAAAGEDEEDEHHDQDDEPPRDAAGADAGEAWKLLSATFRRRFFSN